MRKMKKEMREMLQHIWEVFGYLDTEVEYYAEKYEITLEEVHELYNELGIYIGEKYKLEE